MKDEVNIYQIAREADVSPATVSRVMTGSARVSDEKKRRVQEIIRKYDYRPNALAQGLTTTRTRNVGIVAADIENPYYTRIITRISRELEAEGYNAVIYDAMNRYDLEVKCLQRMVDTRADALILMGGKSDEQQTDPDYADLINRISDNIPIVTTGKVDGARVYQVCIDEMSGVDLAMEHLFSRGHRHIALIGGHGSVRSTFEKRTRYRSVLKARGITYRERYIMDSDYDIAGGYKCMNELFHSNIGRTMPTAVMAINDFSAVGVEHAIRERGLRIPEDIAVLSFDNTFIAESIMPRLTAVGYAYDDFGQKLAATAVALAGDKEVPAYQLIPSKLFVRESTVGEKEMLTL